MAISMSGTHAPERTCVGCRQRAPASELVRLIAPEGRPIVVLAQGRGDLPRVWGRGAWMHPNAGCLLAAAKTRAFSRAFKRAIELPNASELAAQVENARRPR